MRLENISIDFISHMKMWYRSKGTVFWAIAFPVLLMLIFGAIFSTSGEYSLTLYIQDLDDTQASEMLINNLSDAFKIKKIPSDIDAEKYIKDKGIKAALIIPKGFQDTIVNASLGENSSIELKLFLDPSQESSNGAIRSIVSGTLQGWNMNISKTRNVILYEEESVISESFEYIDFFMPGVIGLTVMTNAIYGTIFRNTKYRKRGILRKLTTTPMKRSEWLLAKMLFMTVLSFISTFVILIVGIAVFSINVKINFFMFFIIISASFAFAGIGMIITRFVREEETADSAAGAITFPMMFLAGTFFPLEIMPEYLQVIAKVLPLYYVNEGLRDAMIYGNFSGAVFNAMVTFGIALFFFIIGVLITSWKED